eukprot:2389277-Pleurochrysis_carterae.AAC.1
MVFDWLQLTSWASLATSQKWFVRIRVVRQAPGNSHFGIWLYTTQAIYPAVPALRETGLSASALKTRLTVG